MKAVIAYDQVIEVIAPGEFSYEIPVENWSHDIQTIKIIENNVLPFIHQGLAYDIHADFYDQQSLLDTVKAQRKQEFSTVFVHLDTLSTRPAQSITEALSEGADIDALDQNMLWQYSQIKQANRESLAQLTAATTWEEAEAIRPWKPWEAPTLSANPHSNAVQNLYEIDNARLPS